MQFLSNLSQKTAIILWILTSLVFVASKGKRIQKLTKIVKIEEVKKIHIS